MGYFKQRPVEIDELSGRFKGFVTLDHDPSGHRQRPVEPGIHDRASVNFCVQFQVFPFHRHFCMGFDPESRRITMCTISLKPSSAKLPLPGIKAYKEE